MPRVQEYWLPGYGLSRQIVLRHIQYFLGPSATVRPYSYQEQIDDLKAMSREYERQEAIRMASLASIDSLDRRSGQFEEPYINELVPIGKRPRRRPAEYDNPRNR
ncbi:hypothetical protein M432DRAFT_586881 [Thermoascus aurantiacus ATCC 26904]